MSASRCNCGACLTLLTVASLASAILRSKLLEFWIYWVVLRCLACSWPRLSLVCRLGGNCKAWRKRQGCRGALQDQRGSVAMLQRHARDWNADIRDVGV